MSRDERRRPAPGAHRGERDADDDSDDLRYEGPISFNDLDDDDEEYNAAPGGGRVFFTATIIGAVVILLVAAALWLRRDRSAEQSLADARTYGRSSLPESAPPDIATEDEPAPSEQPTPAPAPPDEAPAPFEDRAAAAPRTVRPAPQTAREIVESGAYAPVPTPAREVVGGASESEIDRAESAAMSGSASPAPGSSGDIDDAAQRGLALARSAGAGAYSLQVLYACREATVRRALSGSASPELFVVPAGAADGRACYRLLWGRYPDRSAAVAASGSIPQHFREAGAPLPFALDKIATP